MLGKTVEELMTSISSVELTEWQAFLRLENQGAAAAAAAEDPAKVENDLRSIFGRPKNG